ncbi:hypothetical protein [Desulfonatronum thiodismutans]|uniref:hypothetical protein n=1 Tax=Desulfonatronum thiodismutans TaxID=159290 RepID=UPI00126896A5|nr:hypothetical protein [Desulfonatronum thiodismutans]
MARSIEFLGLPGSGKSTISDAFKTELRKRGFRVSSARELLHAQECNNPWHIVYSKFLIIFNILRYGGRYKFVENQKDAYFNFFLRNHPRYVEICNDLILKLPYSVDLKTQMIRWLKDEGAGWSKYKKEVNSKFIYLNDEGFLHRALTYFSFNYDNVVFRNYMNLCPKHDIVVVVNTPVNIAMDRRLSNYDYTFKPMGISGTGNIIKMYKLFDSIISKITESICHEKIIYLDGTRHVFFNVEILNKYIKMFSNYNTFTNSNG